MARAVLLARRRGTLAEQLAARLAEPSRPPSGRARRCRRASAVEPFAGAGQLEFFNGLGGFAADGREYVTILEAGAVDAGAVDQRHRQSRVRLPGSESEGSGYTWSLNSRENQLTPWSNDPVTDPPGEALYVRDEETGELWGPTALPIREETAPYVAAHGQGYSRFEHEPRTASRSISSSSCRSTIRSRSRG